MVLGGGAGYIIAFFRGADFMHAIFFFTNLCWVKKKEVLKEKMTPSPVCTLRRWWKSIFMYLCASLTTPMCVNCVAHIWCWKGMGGGTRQEERKMWRELIFKKVKGRVSTALTSHLLFPRVGELGSRHIFAHFGVIWTFGGIRICICNLEAFIQHKSRLIPCSMSYTGRWMIS